MSADMHLAAFVADLQWRDVPVDVAQKVVRHVLDALGVMCAGLSDPSSAAVRSVASEAGSSLEASIVGSAMGGPAPLAAFVNAFHGRIHTFDDTYEAGPVHAGAVVLSSALAAGQRWHASGVDVLTAVLAGHEVAVRVANALGPGHYASGFHCTGTCNALGAAAAAARVMGLDLDGVVGALGHAGGAAAGLRQYQETGSMTDSALNGGRAAQTGVTSALLSSRGLSGPTDILGGRWGVCRMFAETPDLTRLDTGLGDEWVFRATSLKPYPTCRYTHGPIASLLELRRVHEIQPCMVETVEIFAFRQSIEVSDRPRVTSRFDAIMSHQFGAAVALAKGWVGLDSLEFNVRTDPLVQELISKVFIRHEPAFDTLYPTHWSHKVCVCLTNGSRFEAESRNPPGGEDLPIGNAELLNKFVSLAEPVLGELGVERLRKAVEGLSEIEDVASLAPLLTGNAKS